EGHSRQCRGSRSDLDAAHSFDVARGKRQQFRQAGADETAGQPAELATAYVMLADPLSSYVSGTTIAVTGGKPIL
ncbi:short-chain dehydrogenase/reductase SDR, partial [Rhizobium sp. Pop5]